MIKSNRFLYLLAAATLSAGMLACSSTSTTDTSTSTSTDMAGTTAVTTTTTSTTTETDVNALEKTESGLNRDNTYANGVTDPTTVKQENAMNTNAAVKVTPNIGTTGNVEAVATKETSMNTSTSSSLRTTTTEPTATMTTTTTTSTTETDDNDSDDDTATTTTTHRRMSKN